MKCTALFLSFLWSIGSYAQVEVDVPIQFTGSSEQRGFDGLALPATQDAAISVEATVLGVANWAEASVVGNAITLQPSVPLTTYRDGQLLRFISPTNVFGELTLTCVGLAPGPVMRPDGVWPARGQIRAGVICEVLYADGTWILMNAPEKECPPGTVAANAHLCVEVTGQDGLLFYPAADRCQQMGGRLCKWSEFHAACTLLNAELNGLLSSWEWLDDTQNHAHSAVNVGFQACTAQRWSVPFSNTVARSRCCFEPR